MPMRLKSLHPFALSRLARTRSRSADEVVEADVSPDSLNRESDESPGGAPVGRFQRNRLSLVVSLLVHCLLVVAMGLFTLSAGPANNLPGEIVKIGELPAEVLDSSEFDSELDEAVSAEAEPILDETELTLVEQPLGEVEQLTVDSPSIMNLGASGERPLQGLGDPSGSGASGQASFMGVQAYGRRFCIIADRSGSMAGRPLSHVKVEIRKTLDTMSTGSSIHMVFYANDWTACPEHWGIAGEIRDEVEVWLREIASKGGTRPAESFLHAFELSPPPDAIFFMTDGKIPAAMEKMVADLNSKRGKKIPVHTIAFLNRAAAPLLKRIAEQSGGKFRFVAGF